MWYETNIVLYSSYAAKVHSWVCIHHHIGSWPNCMAFVDILRISECQLLLWSYSLLRHSTDIPYHWPTFCLYKERIYFKTWVVAPSWRKSCQISTPIIVAQDSFLYKYLLTSSKFLASKYISERVLSSLSIALSIMKWFYSESNMFGQMTQKMLKNKVTSNMTNILWS